VRIHDDDDLMLPSDLTWCPGADPGQPAPCGRPDPELGHYYSPAEEPTTDTRPYPSGGEAR
jgi:hypothetical protein